MKDLYKIAFTSQDFPAAVSRHFTNLFLYLFIILSISASPTHSHHQQHNQLSSLYRIYTNSTSSLIPIPTRTRSISNITKIKRSSLWEIENIASKVESLTFSQSLLRNIAAEKVKEKLADVSFHWSNHAQEVVAQKYSEVIRLTSESQEAELQRLRHASTAQLLNDAVFKASRVYNSSLSRFRVLEAAAEAAKHTLKLISEALSLVLYINFVRDNWSTEERARAFRLSSVYLQKVLKELKDSLEFAQTAKAVVTDM